MSYRGVVRAGAGGASKWFVREGGIPSQAFAATVGYLPVPGTLNLHLDRDFDWDADHLRVEVPVRKRVTVRLYPVLVDDVEGHAVRRLGAPYAENFVEVMAPVRLRDRVGREVRLSHREVGG